MQSRPGDAPLTVDTLRSLPVFGALSDDVLGHFATSLSTIRIGPGEAVFREGDVGREAYVVLEGEIEVAKRSKRGHDHRVAILGPADLFGEMSVIDMQPRSATLRALAPTRLLKISAEDLDALYRRDVKAYVLVVLNIARELSRRLRVADGLLAEFTASVIDHYVRRPSPPM